jgi:hypothetical protein
VREDRVEKVRHVHIFYLVRVKIPQIKSKSDLDAINKALELARPEEQFRGIKPIPPASDVEYAEDYKEALVDHEGDAEYEHSQWYLAHGPRWVKWPAMKQTRGSDDEQDVVDGEQLFLPGMGPGGKDEVQGKEAVQC